MLLVDLSVSEKQESFKGKQNVLKILLKCKNALDKDLKDKRTRKQNVLRVLRKKKNELSEGLQDKRT